MFLRWVKGTSIVEEEESEEDEAEHKRKRRQEEANVSMSHGYSVAKTPGYGNVSADMLVNNFGATEFLWYLEDFLLAHSLPIPPTHNVPFGVFKRVSVTLPRIPQVSDLTDLKDTIRTTLPEPSRNRKKAVPAQFDTVLAFEKASLPAFSDPSNPLKGV
jgi:hypothetical protein